MFPNKAPFTGSEGYHSAHGIILFLTQAHSRTSQAPLPSAAETSLYNTRHMMTSHSSNPPGLPSAQRIQSTLPTPHPTPSHPPGRGWISKLHPFGNIHLES